MCDFDTQTALTNEGWNGPAVVCLRTVMIHAHDGGLDQTNEHSSWPSLFKSLQGPKLHIRLCCCSKMLTVKFECIAQTATGQLCIDRSSAAGQDVQPDMQVLLHTQVSRPAHRPAPPKRRCLAVQVTAAAMKSMSQSWRCLRLL
jgi:hypothetical protein